MLCVPSGYRDRTAMIYSLNVQSANQAAGVLRHAAHLQFRLRAVAPDSAMSGGKES
jgi:hypothetical protein